MGECVLMEVGLIVSAILVIAAIVGGIIFSEDFGTGDTVLDVGLILCIIVGVFSSFATMIFGVCSFQSKDFEDAMLVVTTETGEDTYTNVELCNIHDDYIAITLKNGDEIYYYEPIKVEKIDGE